MKSVFRKFPLVLAALAVLSLPLAACNTMEGIGKDTKAAGEAISDSARDTKGY